MQLTKQPDNKNTKQQSNQTTKTTKTLNNNIKN